VVDHPIIHLHFTDGVIALEVVGVIQRVPQAKFNG
jgi:hypothetical protein